MVTCVVQKTKKHNYGKSCDAGWNKKTSRTAVFVFDKFADRSTLYIIDECSATKELTDKNDMLSQLAFFR